MSGLVWALVVAVVVQLPTVEEPSRVQAPARPGLAELDAAEARYRAAIALHPSVAAYHLSLAEILEQKGKTEQAITHLREAQTIAPQDAEVARLIAEAEAAALPADDQGYHDYSEFELRRRGWVSYTAELLLGGILLFACIPLLGPILGALFLMAVQAPYQWARSRRGTAG
jgi:tetratricopeptide (TPR) repeat protein